MSNDGPEGSHKGALASSTFDSAPVNSGREARELSQSGQCSNCNAPDAQESSFSLSYWAYHKQIFEEFDEFLAVISLKSDYLVLSGDFNIHMETGDSAQLLQITDSYGLKQLVKVPTHQCGGTLDLVFDNSNLILESSLNILKWIKPSGQEV